MALTKQEAGRLGGQTTVARYGSLYMAWLGHRGGCNEMARQLREAAASTPYPVMTENYLEDAAAWAVDTGTKVMLGLWLGCEQRPDRLPANGEITRLRRWERSVAQW